MPTVELQRTMLRVAEAVIKRFQCLLRQVLVTLEQPLGILLRLAPVNAPGTALKVEHKPQLNARVRERDVDAVGCGRIESLVEVRMLVAIEDAPILVTRTTKAATLIALVLLALLDGFFDESSRRAVEVVDGDDDLISVFPKPVIDVVGFGAPSLGEDIEAAVGDPSRRRRAGSPSLRFPSLNQGVAVATRSAASANPPSMRIGRAP